jgi:capsule polysaccharide export protein KpsE/RkpR
MKVSAILPLGLIMSGCVATNCSGDPRFDSLGCASSGLSSGAYHQQTARLQMQAAAQSGRAQREEVRARSSAAQAVATSEARADAQAAVAAQDLELASLRSQLTRLQTRLDTARAQGANPEVAQLEREIAALKSRISSVRAR